MVLNSSKTNLFICICESNNLFIIFLQPEKDIQWDLYHYLMNADVLYSKKPKLLLQMEKIMRK